MTSIYAPRDVKAQGEHFLRHDLEMTVYDLRDKFAIAGELAHRDIEIERLHAELEAIKKQVPLTCTQIDDIWDNLTPDGFGKSRYDIVREIEAAHGITGAKP